MNLKYHLTPAAENYYAYFRPATPSSAGIDLRWIGPEINGTALAFLELLK